MNYVLKKSEIYADALALRNAEDFSTELEKFLDKYRPSENRGPRSTVKFDVLQTIIDKTALEGYTSFGKLALAAASQYNVKYGKKNPINPAFFQKWVEKGKISMPIYPARRTKTIILETTPSGEEL